eukprot:COSAG06_NODE_320_length_17586_cov_9.121347_18_plen_90_part_00
MPKLLQRGCQLVTGRLLLLLCRVRYMYAINVSSHLCSLSLPQAAGPPPLHSTSIYAFRSCVALYITACRVCARCAAGRELWRGRKRRRC